MSSEKTTSPLDPHPKADWERTYEYADFLANRAPPCEWKLDDPDQGTWESSCGNAFTIMVGTPTENNMRFCCYCGRPVKEHP